MADSVQLGMDTSSFNCMSVPDLDDPFFNVTGEEASQFAVFEALQNGLGQEDFSEGWNLLTSLFNQIPAGLQIDANVTIPEDQAWVSATGDQAPEPDHDKNDGSLDAKSHPVNMPPSASSDQDIATMAAASLQELLNGCLV